jgi:hypothetical protein
MTKLPDDHDELEKIFYIAVGKVIREWAELEATLQWWLTQLLQTDSFRTRVVWGGMPNIRARVQLLRRLVETYIDEPAQKQAHGVLDRVERLGGKRNALAHCHGHIDTKTKKLPSYKISRTTN